MYKIRDWLYISGFPAASSPSMIKKEGIQGMLQLFEAIEMDGVETKHIGLLDGVPIKPQQLQDGIAFIHAQREKNHRLLVTCGAGISRSVTLSIVALKEIEGLSMQEAYSVIHKVHPKAMPDHLHWESVANYYDENNNFWEVWGEITLSDMDD